MTNLYEFLNYLNDELNEAGYTKKELEMRGSGAGEPWEDVEVTRREKKDIMHYLGKEGLDKWKKAKDKGTQFNKFLETERKKLEAEKGIKAREERKKQLRKPYYAEPYSPSPSAPLDIAKAGRK